jgi:predicted outer membrane repeat protein
MLAPSAGDVVHCNFTANTAHTTGGAITVAHNATLSMQGSFLHGNSATAYAGGLNLLMRARAKVWNTSFTANTALERGGAVYISSAAGLLLRNSVLKLNSASMGGAVLADDDSFLDVWHSSFIANNASWNGGSGGALGLWGNVTAHLNAVVLDDNTAKYAGAICVEDNATLHLLASKLSHNAANKSGAAFYAGGKSSVRLEGCRLTGNSAMSGAGMAMFDSSSASIINSVFVNNTALDTGGGLHIADTAHIRVFQSEFLQNTVFWKGGALRLLHNSCPRVHDGHGCVCAAHQRGVCAVHTMAAAAPRQLGCGASVGLPLLFSKCTLQLLQALAAWHCC